MSRTKQAQADPITGVTTRRGKIIRVQLGRTTIMDLEHLERRSIFRKTVRHPIDKKDAQALARQARRWLKPPPGSVLI